MSALNRCVLLRPRFGVQRCVHCAADSFWMF
jgi:hypothetical protein